MSFSVPLVELVESSDVGSFRGIQALLELPLPVALLDSLRRRPVVELLLDGQIVAGQAHDLEQRSALLRRATGNHPGADTDSNPSRA